MKRLFGRGDVVERARLCAERAAAGEGALLLLSGEAGIGKSRLAEHVAALAAERGTRVVWGRCWEAGGAPPYWPWVQVFRALEIPEEIFDGAIDLGPASEQARFLAFDRAIRRLKAAAGQGPLALVLDDLHAADVPSLLVLLLLARELRQSRLLVIGVFRDTEVDQTPEIGALLAKLAREGEVVNLSRLAPEAVREWVRDSSPALTEAQASDVYRLTEGHPLFVTEVLRLGADQRRGVLHGLRGVLDQRLSPLSPQSRAVLEVAAVLGREFTAPEVAALADLGLDEVHERCREAAEAGVIAEQGDRLGFSHVLLRDHLYAGLTPSRKAALHWKAGVTRLERGEPAAAAIHHLLEGESAGEPARIAEAALAAAEASLARVAFEDAARFARRGLAGRGPAALRCRLSLVLAEALIRSGEREAGKAAAEEAAELARQDGAVDLLARAVLVYGIVPAPPRGNPRLVSLLRDAQARLPAEDSPLRARVLIRLAAALTPPSSWEEVPGIMALGREAMEMTRRLGDPLTRLHVLQFMGMATGWMVTEEEHLATEQEIVALARTLDQPLALLNVYPAYITRLLACGHRSDAEASLAAYQELLQDFPQPEHRLRLLMLRSLFRALAGDAAGVDRLVAESTAVAERAESVAQTLFLMRQQFCFAHLLVQPTRLVERCAAILPHVAEPQARAMKMFLLATAGRREEAAQAMRPDSVHPHYFILSWFMADTAVVLGDVAAARVFYPMLAPLAEWKFWTLGSCVLFGPPALTLGNLAMLLGEHRQAISHYDVAIGICDRTGAVVLAEHCRRLRDAALAGAPAAAAPPIPVPQIDLRREGDVWTLQAAGGPVRLKHSKGLEYLRCLMDRPGREVHVLELVGVEHQTGDAGPVLDPQARTEYRRRVEDLEEELAEAERFGDQERARRAREEMDAIAEQLAGAVGLGGRDRRAASDVERARINVQRRLKDTIDRITSADPTLGRFLTHAVRTGIFCAFSPL